MKTWHRINCARLRNKLFVVASLEKTSSGALTKCSGRLEAWLDDGTDILLRTVFKQALEQRLRSSSKNGFEFARKRQLLVFDRFLARVATVLGDSVMLKGGLVLELRLDRARTTKDVDLRLMGSPDATLVDLQKAARLDLGDLLEFEIARDQVHPSIQNEGMQYEGLRFRARCTLAGAPYGQPFGVDASFGEPIFGEPEIVVAEDMLGFAGIAPPAAARLSNRVSYRRKIARIHNASASSQFACKGFSRPCPPRDGQENRSEAFERRAQTDVCFSRNPFTPGHVA
jgi:hypothetical protein